MSLKGRWLLCSILMVVTYEAMSATFDYLFLYSFLLFFVPHTGGQGNAIRGGSVAPTELVDANCDRKDFVLAAAQHIQQQQTGIQQGSY